VDALSILGIIIGVIAIIGGNALDGGHISGLINGPAFVIVIGGTFGAVMLQTPYQVFFRAFQMLPWVFSPPSADLEVVRRQIVQWAARSRKDGLLGLESIAETEKREFYKKGLQLMVDGTDPDAIRSLLENDLVLHERLDFKAAKVFDSMGGYSPTIGIIGAVMGLIHVMGNLDDPTKLGAGIATAFVATIYGVAVANLFLLPIGAKLKTVVQKLSQEKELVIDGLCAIAEGENPRLIEIRLEVYTRTA
tara:strand:+ start:1658 stop:2404 length:747 start_codon:yes stop_codon:yes gene_type:complete